MAFNRGDGLWSNHGLEAFAGVGIGNGQFIAAFVVEESEGAVTLLGSGILNGGLFQIRCNGCQREVTAADFGLKLVVPNLAGMFQQTEAWCGLFARRLWRSHCGCSWLICLVASELLPQSGERLFYAVGGAARAKEKAACIAAGRRLVR